MRGWVETIRYYKSLTHAWQWLRAHMDGGPGGLSDLLDLAALLPDDGPALRGGHQQIEGEGVLVPTVPGPVSALPLLSPLQCLAYQGVGLRQTLQCDTPPSETLRHLEYRVCGAVHCDDSLVL